jgi:hypothetical protein
MQLRCSFLCLFRRYMDRQEMARMNRGGRDFEVRIVTDFLAFHERDDTLGLITLV